MLCQIARVPLSECRCHTWWGEGWHAQPQGCAVTSSPIKSISTYQLTEELTDEPWKKIFFFFNLVDWHFAICSLRKNYFWWIYSYWEHFLWKVLKTVEAFRAVNLLSQNYIFKISSGFSFPELRYLTKNHEWKNMKNKIKHCTSPK